MKKYLKVIAIIFLTASAIGFADATYLTVVHYSGKIPPCTIAGCEVVLTSNQSVIAGVPVALLGALYYLSILVLSIFFLDSKKISALRLASFFTIAGLCASIYFVYLQLFVIRQICQYCMLSAFTSIVLFTTGMYTLRKTKEKETPPLPPTPTNP